MKSKKKDMSYRGTGRTTNQIRNLEDGGIFVVRNRLFVEYARNIAKKLGKKITIVSISELPHALIGKYYPAFSIDHDAQDIINTRNLTNLVVAIRRFENDNP